MANDSVVLRFSDVTFEYGHNKRILDDASFSVRAGSRITLMGQNGAGKSSLFKMITGEIQPTSGDIHRTPKDATIAIARQVMPLEVLDLSVREYFATAFSEKKYNLDKLIKDIFEVVNFNGQSAFAPNFAKASSGKKASTFAKATADESADATLLKILDKRVAELSGGQQARLLLAHALIQNPDILLLDEPTNNLDQQGIEHLTGFLMMYEKTVIVISHDADFLNAFSDGVLYLDVFTHKIEQYTGNYYDVVEEIKNRIERENLQNARMQSEIKEKRTQAEVFAHKGGKLRAVAKRMRQAAEEAASAIVEVRQEDKTIRAFEIPCQEFGKFFDGKIMEFSSVSAIKNHKPITKELELVVRKNTHIIVSGPNGIGKSTLLEKIATSVCHCECSRSNPNHKKDCFVGSTPRNDMEGFILAKDIKVGHYKQDFSNFKFEQKAFDALKEVMEKFDEHILRAAAAGFLIDGKLLDQPIAALSEGQKGLLSFCRLALMKPGLLILDEPTNHINFRHLPVIAKALDAYQGAMLIVSHIPDFVSQIRIDETIDLASL